MKPNTKPTANEIRAVLEALESGPRWIKGKDLAKRAGVAVRKIRAVAQETGEVISGQAGYCATRRARWEEVAASNRDLNSRARQLVERAQKQARIAHNQRARPRNAPARSLDLPL